MAKYEGKCPQCGKTYWSDRKGDIIVCDCWKDCPTCGAGMTPHAPDLAMNTYGFDDRRDLAVLMVCTLHFPMFFSNQKPVEVVCS
jgi:ssDNA-binding Zn-finger/Zn-ribbon topoisomerase 1